MRSILVRWLLALPALLAATLPCTTVGEQSDPNPMPRAPQEGLTYLEKMFLPEPVPEEGSFVASASSWTDTPAPKLTPADFLAGTSFTWTSMSPPDGRYRHSMVYDSIRNRVLVFGGVRKDLGVLFLNDTWELQFSPSLKWKYLGASGTIPEARAGHVAIFDPVGNRMLVWGGDDSDSETPPPTALGALSLSSSPMWSQPSSSGTPPAGRYGAATVYDPLRRRLLLFGGLLANNTCSTELWELRLGPTLTWNRLTPSNFGPSGRFSLTAALDESGNRILVHGGTDGTTVFADVWSLHLSDPPVWELLSPSGIAPAPRYTHLAAFDAAEKRMVIATGASSNSYLSDSWTLELDPEPRWVRLSPENETLYARSGSAGVVIPEQEVLLLFGGYVRPVWPDMCLDDTWKLRLTPGTERWDLVVDSNQPDIAGLGRDGHSAVLDSHRDRMVIFGGTGIGGPRYDTWSIPLQNLDAPPHWTQVLTQGTTHPDGRSDHTAIYDPVGDRMIVFGGGWGIESPPFGDCWELKFGVTPPLWKRITFTGATPSARWKHAAIYDPSRRWMILFGGDTSTQFLNDLWVLDLNDMPTWTQLTPSGTLPGPRALHSLVLDQKHDRILVYGGDNRSSGADYGDVWALALGDPSHWTEIQARYGNVPFYRNNHAAAYDTLNDRMLIYGGCSDANIIDLWSWTDQAGSVLWTQLPVPNGPSLKRCGRSAVLDESQGAWLLYGGRVVAETNSLWNLQWDVPVAVQITFSSVRRDGDGIVLEWRTSEPSQGAFCVGRELPGLARERISDAVPLIQYGYSFRDSSDPPVGTRYYLELLDRAGGTTLFGPYALTEGPGILGVGAQLMATPNPFQAGVRLTARNLAAGDVAVEVCSVAGRVVHQEPPIAGFRGGNAEIQIPSLDALPAGIYFIRVRVGATSISTRAVKLM